jgi:dUTP pyrophosphatase
MQEQLLIPLVQLDPGLNIPKYAYPGDGGVDLQSVEEVTLAPFERKLISTGISIALPEGFAAFVIPRSGLAIKHGISLVNTPGLIDSNYRGEIKVIAINLDAHESFDIKRGDRIAQLVVMRVENIAFDTVAQLPETLRGSGGFGSSGL